MKIFHASSTAVAIAAKLIIVSAIISSWGLVAADFVTETCEFFSNISQEEIDNLKFDQLLANNVESKAEIIEILKSKSHSSVHRKLADGTKLDYGFTFAHGFPWTKLTAQAIKDMFDRTGERVTVGSWGCGYGYSEALLLLAGADLKALDLNEDAANSANRYLFSLVRLSKIGDMKSPKYTVAHASVENPPRPFMDRKNQINVCFNVMHYLRPEQNERLLDNLYNNTLDGGFVVISCMALDEELVRAYNMLGDYPGYKLYSEVYICDNQKRPRFTLTQISEVTDENENAMWASILEPVVMVKNRAGSRFEAAAEDLSLSSYSYLIHHRVVNKFTIEALEKLLAKHGFVFVKGFEADEFVYVIVQKPIQSL
jgi:SAM-dependent methyltransferase